MFENIFLEKAEGIATIILSKPEKLNLFSRKLMTELKTAIEQMGDDDDIGVMIITGGDHIFGVGLNIHEAKDLTPTTAREFIIQLHSTLDSVRRINKPVIASIAGYCLGGHFELILTCDFRIAAENAVFGLPEIKVGVPSVIEAALLARFIGIGRATEMIFTGDSIDAQEAARYGLVNKVVPIKELKNATNGLARKLLSNGPMVTRAQKAILNEWLETNLKTAIEYSMNAFARHYESGEPKEAMTAFLEKRPPRFRGGGRPA